MWRRTWEARFEHEEYQSHARALIEHLVKARRSLKSVRSVWEPRGGTNMAQVPRIQVQVPGRDSVSVFAAWRSSMEKPRGGGDARHAIV